MTMSMEPRTHTEAVIKQGRSQHCRTFRRARPVIEASRGRSGANHVSLSSIAASDTFWKFGGHHVPTVKLSAIDYEGPGANGMNGPLFPAFRILVSCGYLQDTACDAVARWVEMSGIAPGTPLFRSVSKSGRVLADRLGDDGVAVVVKGRIIEREMAKGATREEAEASPRDTPGTACGPASSARRPTRRSLSTTSKNRAGIARRKWSTSTFARPMPGATIHCARF
jgi:hypothetical protein